MGSAPSRADLAPHAPPPARASRHRLFVVVTLALPWLLLALVELGLRAAGYGSDYPLFVRHATQPDWLTTNPDVARRWFRGPFVPTPELDFFRASKAPAAFRVFFQGESSAQGFPYGHGGAPSRMLQQRLQETFPDREIEVVNTAFTAVNSYALLDEADEIIAHQPDAVLVYTGHNEYYGAFGAGSPQALPRPLVRAYLALLRHLRTAQLLANAIGAGRAAAAANDPGSPRTVMQLMAAEQHIPLGSARYRQGMAQFRANLDDLLDRYERHGVRVFIGTVASNEHDQPPFEGAQAARSWAQARAAEARGDTARARTLYRAAKEEDELRFRAPEAVNVIIREVAARHGATVVETQRALEQLSPGGVVGHAVILEHLHPNLDGYFAIADAFYEALHARGLPAPGAAEVPAARARAGLPVTPIDSLVGAFRTDRLTSGWPFRPRGRERVPAVDTLHPTTEPQRLAQAVVLGNLPWAEATERLRTAYEQAGDREGATRAALALGAEYRWSPQPWEDAARVALAAQRWDDAIRFTEQAVARRPTPGSVQLVGLLMLRQGQDSAALPWLERAARLAPGNPRLTVPLTAARELPALERRRVAAPRDTAVLYELAAAYAFTQQYEKSRDALHALLRVAPAHARGRELERRLPPAAPPSPVTAAAVRH